MQDGEPVLCFFHLSACLRVQASNETEVKTWTIIHLLSTNLDEVI